MKTNTEDRTSVGHDEIATLARQIWESEGRQPGRDLDYWLRAERRLLLGRNRRSNLPVNATAMAAGPAHGTSKAIRLPDSRANIDATK